jgi:hypothetical protein
MNLNPLKKSPNAHGHSLLDAWNEKHEAEIKMKNLLLAWIHDGQGSHSKSVAWPDIEEKLKCPPDGKGSITLDLEDEENRQRALQVIYESKQYLLTLGLETSDDWVVKGYRDINASIDQVVILGDSWRGDNICRDAERVHTAFKQFFETGDVSDDVWTV